MILQVNKKKKKEDISNYINSEGFISTNAKVSLEERLGSIIEYDNVGVVFSPDVFGRKRGKTTLINKLAKKYNLPIIVSCKAHKRLLDYKNSFSMDQDLRGMGIELALVDEISYSENYRLNNIGIKTIGFLNDSEQPKEKIYEDYIDVSNIQQKDSMITAEARNGQINLYRDKKFDDNRDDNYNVNNLDYIIESAYLLDDTGKTIKKLM